MGIAIGSVIGVPFYRPINWSRYWAANSPTGLTATIISDIGVRLDWTSTDTKSTGVSIERSTDGVTYTEIATVPLGVITYTDNSLIAATLYYYRVRAFYGDVPLLIPSGLILTLISGGITIDFTDNNSVTAQTEIWGQSDGGASAILYTINAGIVTRNDTGVNPVDLRYYKIRGLRDGVYTSFTGEVSIAMLYPERVSNGGFADDTNWVRTGSPNNCWTIAGGKANFLGNVAYNRTLLQYGHIVWLGKKYRIKFNISGITTSGNILFLSGTSISVFESPYNAYISVINGDYTWYANSIAADVWLLIYAQVAPGDYSLDNLSMKEIKTP